MKRAVSATIWVVGSWAAGSACSAIAGFDDFHRDCPDGLFPGQQKGVPTCVSEAGIAGDGTGGRPGNGAAGHAGAGEDGRDASVAGGAGNGKGASAGGGAESGTGGASGAVGTGAGGTTLLPTCSAGAGGRFHGPGMAKVMRTDGTAFLIDRTEVTFGDYDAFLGAHAAQPMDPNCSGPSLPLNAPCAALLTEADAGAVDPALPRVCVDWCDAEAYCRWAGKELCPDTASTSPAEQRTKSDFYLACSEDGSRYGCGPGCSAADCNGADSSSSRAVAVGTMTTCAVGSDACPIYDLSGNVEEWTNAATPNGPTGACSVRGGSYQSSEADLHCDVQKFVARRGRFVTTGFRCCVDPA